MVTYERRNRETIQTRQKNRPIPEDERHFGNRHRLDINEKNITRIVECV